MRQDARTGLYSGCIDAPDRRDMSKPSSVRSASTVCPPNHRIDIIDGSPIPTCLGRLRYEKYIREQSKFYPDADHVSRMLGDEIDAFSIHILCWSGDGELGAALRLTPMTVVRELELFANLLSRCDTSEISVVLSRLVRCNSRAGARSIRPIFKFTYDFCLRHGWPVGILHTSPRLMPLFLRYGWREAGNPFQDPVSGVQVPLMLDALDVEHLQAVSSPYLVPTSFGEEAADERLRA
jgi:predicted GNAT family N-acyltransferase